MKRGTHKGVNTGAGQSKRVDGGARENCHVGKEKKSNTREKKKKHGEKGTTRKNTKQWALLGGKKIHAFWG